MATLEQNLRKIRGEAIAGTDVREAIAAAIEQTDSTIHSRVTTIQNQVNSRNLYLDLISLNNGEYRLRITNASGVSS